MASEHEAAEGHHDPLDPGHLIGHVKDQSYFEVPQAIDVFDGKVDGKAMIGQPFYSGKPLLSPSSLGLEALDPFIAPIELKITKFMVIEAIAAFLVAVVFISLAARIRGGGRPTGRVWNFFEAMLLFIRDQVARPTIGSKSADKFLPFLWTLFFFILACNLMGMVPWLGSPTGSLSVTGVLAIISFVVVCMAGVQKWGGLGFVKHQVPHMDLPIYIAVPLIPLIFVIEAAGLVIKHIVLALRLFANMMAGHLVLAVIITFVKAADVHIGIWGVATIGPMSVLGAVAISLLELFVAFLQAYIFTFLASLFIGMATHSH